MFGSPNHLLHDGDGEVEVADSERALELGSGDVAGAAGVHAVEPLPEHHRVLHLLPPGSPRSGVGEPARTTTVDRGYANY